MGILEGQGSLPNHNVELLKCIQELQAKRLEVSKQISSEEAERQKLQQDLAVLTSRLSHIDASLLRKTAVRDEYDKVIRETEGAYEQIVQSSQTLLTILKKECSNINRKQQVAQVA
ncbi:deflagellation inducible protein [Coccomyxa subellipsoidea C-169]|uniref:Deflagellation inducible protein n=1 Tax=Coccomyxa subellipsoidea (strain C-169) TaxID=574566 RepID=I0YSQ6_COCSC|nr:deflagellation inducible protein [Coccomyxa subellipsoidea C-169]EIE21425.1 deflagellation inducible protein [Coccomyxa subellipsoidea C-169]|eukprot:XP_005645969.1 deflagellation inducible protein [Coccomyxa subellipsoidea C-169]